MSTQLRSRLDSVSLGFSNALHWAIYAWFGSLLNNFSLRLSSTLLWAMFAQFCSCLRLTSCTVYKVLLDLMVILWLNPLKLWVQNNDHNHTQTLSHSHLQNIEGKFLSKNAGMLTYNLPFGHVKKLYGAQQRSSNKKRKFKKHHVA